MGSRRIAAMTAQSPHAASRRLKTRTTLMGVAFLVPAFILMTYSNFIPAIWNLILSFQTGGFGDLQWTGLQNYVTAVGDSVFLKSLWNSTFIAVVTTAFAVVFGVALALMIYQLGRYEGAFYRLVIFMPTMLPLAITGLMFIFVFNQESGLLNNFLRLIGLGDLAQPWLAKPPLNLYAICVVGIWRIVGLPMIFTYAALQSIPASLLEASKLDGATYLDDVRLVLLPLLKPIIATATIFTFIINFKAFDLVFVLTRGGPGNTSRVVPLNIVETAFTFNQFGYAASMGVIMTLVVLVLTGIINRILRSEVYEY
jgi:raffinose/stachyose/melibiose transport system permease protein